MTKPTFKKPFRQILRDNTKAMEALALQHGVSKAGQQHIDELRAEVDAKDAAYKPRAAPGSDGRKLESDVNREIQQAAKLFDNVRLWRNNRGQVELPSGGRLTYGVGPNGASDFIGYRRIRITQEMVGSVVAQFLCIESKRPGEKPTLEQQRFNDSVFADGGQSGVAHSGVEAIAVIRSGK